MPSQRHHQHRAIPKVIDTGCDSVFQLKQFIAKNSANCRHKAVPLALAVTDVEGDGPTLRGMPSLPDRVCDFVGQCLRPAARAGINKTCEYGRNLHEFSMIHLVQHGKDRFSELLPRHQSLKLGHGPRLSKESAAQNYNSELTILKAFINLAEK